MKNKKETSSILKYILLTVIIVCSIFRYKTIFIEPNNILEVSISNLLYPISFLLTILIFKKSDFKNTHKTILKISLAFLVFTILISLMNSLPGNYSSKYIDLALKEVLTPNYFMINKTPIYMPNLFNILSYTLLFYFSHILLVILYEAMEPYTKKFIAFSLAMFIPYALDTICYTTITTTIEMVEFNKLIISLTSNFVIVIIYTLIITLLYSFTNIKKVRIKQK